MRGDPTKRMTVAQLIAALQEFRGDLPVVIHDSDTGYLLNIEDVEYPSKQRHPPHPDQPHRVEISGSYMNILGEEADDEE